MLLCLEDDYESPDEQNDKKKRDKERRFQWNHGREFTANVYCILMCLGAYSRSAQYRSCLQCVCPYVCTLPHNVADACGQMHFCRASASVHKFLDIETVRNHTALHGLLWTVAAKVCSCLHYSRHIRFLRSADCGLWNRTVPRTVWVLTAEHLGMIVLVS